MGCSASRNLTVDTLDGTGVVATSKSLKTACEKRETGNNIPDIVGVDPPSELIESGAISNVHKTRKSTTVSPAGVFLTISLQNTGCPSKFLSRKRKARALYGSIRRSGFRNWRINRTAPRKRLISSRKSLTRLKSDVNR